MNFTRAVRDTFRELFTLRDPNNTFQNKVSRPKLKKMIGVYAGAVGVKKPAKLPGNVPNAVKPEYQPAVPPVVAKPPPKPRPLKVTQHLKRAAVTEARDLKNNAKEPFIKDHLEHGTPQGRRKPERAPPEDHSQDHT